MDNEMKFDYYLMMQRLAEASRLSIMKQVNTFLLWMEGESISDVTEVGYNDVMAFVKHCGKEGNSQKTVAIKLAFLNHYFMWLIKEGEMRENPISNINIKGIQRKKLHNILKRDELDKIYTDFQTVGITGERNRVILGLVVYQALRLEEVTNLTVKEIQFREGKIKIAGGRKTNARTMALEAHQIIDLLDYLNDARKELIMQTGKETERLFIPSGGGDQLYNTFQQILKQLKNQNKQVKDWKQLRASVIAHWITVCNLRKAQYLAGHRFISSTEEYKQQDLDELLAEINQFHPLK